MFLLLYIFYAESDEVIKSLKLEKERACVTLTSVLNNKILGSNFP